jgi:FAD/FMN-containing dehydrogenase
VVASVCSRLDTVDAAELVTADGLALVREQIGLEIAIPNRRILLLIECSSTSEQVDVLSDILDEHQGIDVAVAVTPSQRERLWRIREEQTPSINRLGVPFKFDVTVPLPSLAPFVERIPSAVEKVRPGARTFVFGHAADGNMHVNVVGGDGDEVALTEQVLGEVVACGGSISAEHGIGTAKQPWLHMVRSTSEIDAMRSIKAALDPDGIMNPGVLLP